MIYLFWAEDCNDKSELIRSADVFLEGKNLARIGEIKKTAKGAPYCDNYFLSVTHTDNVILLAVSTSPVGVDAEKNDRSTPRGFVGGIANWTAMEAVGKASGEGISLSDVKSGRDFTSKVSFVDVRQDITVAVCTTASPIFVVRT